VDGEGRLTVLSHRERVLMALSHRETDRVPIDFGGGPATQIHPDAYAALLGYLGFEPESALEGPRGEGQVVIPSEPVLQRFDVDVRGLRIAENHRPLTAFQYLDDWGVTWEKAHRTAAYINVEGPLQALDWPAPTDLEAIVWPFTEPEPAVAGLRERAEDIRRASDCAIVLNLPNCSFAQSQRVRGFSEFLEDLLVNRLFAAALLERVTDSLCRLAAAALDAVGDTIDVVSFMDDLGAQTGPLLRPELYRNLVKPHHARFVETLLAHTRAPVLMHSDGAIRDLLGDLIDVGVQAINPVQVSAVGMEPDRLKHDFGAHLAFWGGIDTHHLLPMGAPDDVAKEVRLRKSDLGRGGGYVLASVHHIMAEVPPQNVVAMFDTARLG
jgi:uroporphyrinogen decarboxylase